MRIIIEVSDLQQVQSSISDAYSLITVDNVAASVPIGSHSLSGGAAPSIGGVVARSSLGEMQDTLSGGAATTAISTTKDLDGGAASF